MPSSVLGVFCLRMPNYNLSHIDFVVTLKYVPELLVPNSDIQNTPRPVSINWISDKEYFLLRMQFDDDHELSVAMLSMN